MNQDLNEALLISESKIIILPERRHIMALVEELQRFDKYVGDYKEFIEAKEKGIETMKPVYRQFA